MARPKAFDETTVLEAAMHLFWEQGFHATSIQDLVDRLGVNRGSLYATYGGKEELFRRALEHYRLTSSESNRAFLEAQPSGKTAIEQLFLRAVREGVADGARKGCFVVNATTELSGSSGEIRQFLVLNERGVTALFRAALERAVREGELAAGRDLGALAGFLFTLYSGIQVVSKLDEGPGRLEAVVREGLRVLD